MGDKTYTNYKKRLAGEKVPTHDGDPDVGFYRKPIRNARTDGNKITGWEPIAVYVNDRGALIGLIGWAGNNPANDDRAEMTLLTLQESWTYFCAYPIPEAIYREVAENGKPWPRDLIGEPKQASRTAYPDKLAADLTTLAKLPNFSAIPTATEGRTVERNDNQPETPALPPEAVLMEEIRNVIAANEITEIKTVEESASVGAVRNRLNEFKNKAEKEKEIEFRPVKNALDAITKKWNPVINLAEAEAVKARKLLDTFATKQLQERQAEEARIAKANREAEEANTRLLDRAAANGTEISVEQLAPIQEPVSKPAAQIKTNYGRAVSTKAVQVAKITDQDAVYKFYRTNEQVAALLLKLAQLDTDAGITVPGTTTATEARTK